MMKTRFCPSPTGDLHLGNLRTALFSALFARNQNGVFLLRIEDTDQARSTHDFAQSLQADLRWLGLLWDEGPGCEGNAGPYWQSERHAIYTAYYQQLQDMGWAYPCFCREEELALARKLQRAAGKPPRYSGICQNLTENQIADKMAQGLRPVLRFRVPVPGQTIFQDLVRGEQRFNNADIGDFIIRRADGTASFMFCNAVDDALMGVTHALRGEDHLTNTPRQLMILSALGLPAPQYGHIPLIVGSEGAKLSKREGSVSLRQLRDAGYLPLAINNYLARLGHYYDPQAGFLSFSELAEQFSVSHLGKAPARFDASQLMYWQHIAVAQLTDAEFWEWVGFAVQARVPVNLQNLLVQIVRPNVSFPSEVAHWVDRLWADALEYTAEDYRLFEQAGSEFFSTVEGAVVENGVDYSVVIQQIQRVLGVKGKALFQPLRVALTGQSQGPELAGIFTLLGAERLQNRIARVRQLLK